MAKGKSSLSQTNWHPDFRIAETLPDIKVVRTSFIVNFVVVAVVLILGAVVAFRELTLAELRSGIERFNSTINQRSAANSEAIRKSREFSDSRKKVDDVIAFYTKTYDVLPIVEALSSVCPDNIYYESLSLSHEMVSSGSKKSLRHTGRMLTISIRGVLQGESVEDLAQVDAFHRDLEALPVFENRLESISEPQPRGNATIPYRYEFPVTIQLKSL